MLQHSEGAMAIALLREIFEKAHVVEIGVDESVLCIPMDTPLIDVLVSFGADSEDLEENGDREMVLSDYEPENTDDGCGRDTQGAIARRKREVIAAIRETGNLDFAVEFQQ